MPEDFLQQFREMKDDIKENAKVTMELNYGFKSFIQTQALEQQLMRKDIDQNTKDINAIKEDKKFAQRTVLAEILKYVIFAVASVIAVAQLKG